MKLFNDRVLEGACDIHLHAGPDYIPRYSDAITLAEEARDAGMRAIVVKSHLTSTVGAAQAANVVVPEVVTCASITLNGTVGGLSPRAVVTALKSGAKVVWLPTADAQYAVDKAEQQHWIGHYVYNTLFGYECERLYLLDEAGELKPEVKEIVNVCKQYGAMLSTGHVGPQECLKVAEYAQSIDYDRVEITHVNAWFEDFTVDVCKQLVAYGATISIAAGSLAPHNGRGDPQEIIDMIHAVGAEHVILMTDYGQVNAPAPVDGFRTFYYLMKKYGITEEELNLMIKVNPARLLGLD